jgi:hypothetical protein
VFDIREYQFLSVQHDPNTSSLQVTSRSVNAEVPSNHHPAGYNNLMTPEQILI